MKTYKQIRVQSHAGECLADIDPQKLEPLLNWPACARDWKFLRRVSSHGTWTYRFRTDLGLGEQEYFIKVFNKLEMYQKLRRKLFTLKGLKKFWRSAKAFGKFLVYPMPVKIGFEKGRVLLAKGIPTAQPIAYLARPGRFQAWGFIITGKIPGIVGDNLAEYLKQRKNELGAAAFAKEKHFLIEEGAKLFSRLMQLDFYLPDLRVSNLLVERKPDGSFKLWVIDLAEAEDRKPREHKMLYHLLANPHYASLFTGTDKIRFLKKYISSAGLKKDWPALCNQVSPLLKAWHQKWHQKNFSLE